MSGVTGGHEDWRPTGTIAALQRRSAMLTAIRRYFAGQGYWEVETPLLSSDCCVDAWIEPVVAADPAESSRRLFLQSSPEFAMKRLVAAGADAIYQITRAFRAGEASPRHNREFTMLEWYQVGSDCAAQMDLVEELVRTIAADSSMGPPIAATLPPDPWARYSYDDAFAHAIGHRVLGRTPAELAQIADELGITVGGDRPPATADDWLNLLLAERVEPRLAEQGGVFVYDYPASQCALARVRPGSPPVAERFELYLNGVELCNGYQELTNADELERRMVRQNRLRASAGLRPLPVESRLLQAMRAGLPDCAGVALGLDRLLLWRLGLTDIQEVLSFPTDRA